MTRGQNVWLLVSSTSNIKPNCALIRVGSFKKRRRGEALYEVRSFACNAQSLVEV